MKITVKGHPDAAVEEEVSLDHCSSPPSSGSASTWPKRCGCGAVWVATAWHRLENVGIWDDGVDAIELRHCVCGSTISMRVAVVAATRQSAPP
jgi:hypothetical protein